MKAIRTQRLHSWMSLLIRNFRQAWRRNLLMTFAAALAGAGDLDRAIRLVRDYRRLSRYVEPTLLARWVRALCTTTAEKPGRDTAVRRSYRATQAEGAFDVFVLASA